MITREQFQDGLKKIASAHRFFKMPEQDMLAFWYDRLVNLPPEAFVKACHELAVTPVTPNNILAEIIERSHRSLGLLNAEGAFEILQNHLRDFYAPGFGPSAMVAIANRLSRLGKFELLAYLDRYGARIVYDDNRSALFAQFRDDYNSGVAEERRKALARIEARKQLQAQNAARAALPESFVEEPDALNSG